MHVARRNATRARMKRAIVDLSAASRKRFSQRPVVRGASQVYSCPQVSPLPVLIMAVLATTYSGPIVRFATAPAVAIAFWRLALVLPVTFGLATREPQVRAVREAFRLMLLSGLLLAVHFWTWIASMSFKTGASSGPIGALQQHLRSVRP